MSLSIATLYHNSLFSYQGGFELGLPVVPLDPLSGDWLENIRRMGNALESSLIRK